MNIVKPVLTMKSVSCHKAGKNSPLIIDEFEMVLKARSATAILGEYQSGRNALLDIITGRRKINSGIIEIEDIDRSQTDKINSYVQYLPEDIENSFRPDIRLIEGVLEGLMIQKQYEKVQSIKRCKQLLGKLGFEQEQFKHKFHNLNLRQKTLAVFARALMIKPKLIIFGDIFKNLFFTDKNLLIKQIAIMQAQFDLSYLILSNDMYAIRYLCDRVIVLSAGRIMESGKIDQIFTEPRHPYTEVILWSNCIKNSSKPLVCNGEIIGYQDYETGCPFFNRCRYAIPKCLKSLPPLEKLENGHLLRCLRGNDLKLIPIID